MNRQIVSPAQAKSVRDRSALGDQPQVAGGVPTTESADQLTADDYKDKLLKHIPAEAVTAYLTLDGIIRSAASGSGIKAGLWIAFALGLLGTPLYLSRLQAVTSRWQLIVSTVSFAVWVFALGGAFAQYGWYESWIASVVLVGFTFLIPAFVGTEKPAVAG